LFEQEFFIADIAKESYTYTASGKRKTVQRKDMGE
jgi:histone H3/H4